MNTWNSIIIHKNNIKYQNANSTLVAMLNGSQYKGYLVWISNKLVKSKGGMFKIIYKDDFVFRLRKYDKHNWKEVVNEIELDAAEFAEAFGQDNIPLLHEPEELDPEYHGAIEELIDDEYK